MNESDVEKILVFLETFIRDNIINQIEKFYRGGWSYASQEIFYSSRDKNILDNSVKITCVEFKHMEHDGENINVEISIKITNPELFLTLLNNSDTAQQISKTIKITLRRTDNPNYQAEAYTYSRETFFDDIGRYIQNAST